MNKTKKIQVTAIPGFVARFIPVLVVVVALFSAFGLFYARMILPVFAFEIDLFCPGYEVMSCGTEINDIEGKSIYYRIKIKRPIIRASGVPAYNAEIKLNTVASILYIHPIIVLSLLLAWPGLSLRERGWGVAISLPLMLIAASIDIPLFFISKIETGYPLGTLGEQIRFMLVRFFGNGGRQFLALLVVFATVGLIGIMRVSRERVAVVGPNDPCPCGSGRKYKKCCMDR